jgi:tetratricopeptide (TPR) repeat protein
MRARFLFLLGIGLGAPLYAQEASPDPRIPTFWETVVRPHAKEVTHLVNQSGGLRNRAGQYAEPQQVGERQRLFEEALALLEQAQKLDPQDQIVLHELGMTALDAGEYVKAEAALSALIKLTPDDGLLVQPLAISYQKLHRWDDAVEVCQRGLGAELSPADRSALLRLLGYSYMGQGRLEDAIDAYDRASTSLA